MKNPSRRSLIQSFACAVRGIRHALTRERNLRIHFTAGAFALFLSRYYGFSAAELGLLILCVGFVIACELLNTAVERTVDLETSRFHALARAAKDVAAGAVLISAATSVAVGVLLFWDPTVLRLIWGQVVARPLGWIVAAGVAVGWIVWPQRKT